jgi:hypothetical protein
MKIIILLIISILIVSCKDCSLEEYKRSSHLIKSKYTEKVSNCNMGCWESVYYLIYEDDTYQEVSLDTYLTYNEGDSITLIKKKMICK